MASLLVAGIWDCGPRYPIKVTMENRRDSYRVRLEGSERLDVSLQLADGRKLPGKIATMSLGGIGVLLDASGHGLAVHQQLKATFSLPKETLQHSFAMQVRRVGSGSGANAIGLQFLSSGDEEIDAEREKKIWPFILARQNRDIRTMRTPPRRL